MIEFEVEPIMGADFSGVKVHTDAQADQLSRSIQAKAFTTGQDVFFRQGAYEPGSRGGQELIAHELTHVVQQTGRAVQQGKQTTAETKKVAKTLTTLWSKEPSEVNVLSARSGDKQEVHIQRKVDWKSQYKELEKNSRYDFSYELKKEMPVASGQARCHTIGYDIICRGVMDLINACLAEHKDIALAAIFGMIEAIYPNSGKGYAHQSDAIKEISEKNYKTALEAATQIDLLIKVRSFDNRIRNAANELIQALNNSPENLRVGDSNTNSSIQEGLDVTPTDKIEILPKNEWVYSTKDNKLEKLENDLPVIRAIPDHEKQVDSLIEKTWSKKGEVYVYTSGKSLQSSNHPNMKTSNMTDTSKTNFAIYRATKKHFLLFEMT